MTSDNGGLHVPTETAFYAETLGFKPITTAAYSIEIRGHGRGLVNTISRPRRRSRIFLKAPLRQDR